MIIFSHNNKGWLLKNQPLLLSNRRRDLFVEHIAIHHARLRSDIATLEEFGSNGIHGIASGRYTDQAGQRGIQAHADIRFAVL